MEPQTRVESELPRVISPNLYVKISGVPRNLPSVVIASEAPQSRS